MLITLINQIKNPIWKNWFLKESTNAYFIELDNYITNEYQKFLCYPKELDIFRIFNLIDPKNVKVIILGQDPYSTNDMADGIAFSVKNNLISKSLKNIINVIEKNGFECRDILSGNLEFLVKQGVLLLNTCLTVRENMPLSHANKGWEILICKIIQNIINLQNPICFMLWGNNAQNFTNNLSFSKNNLILKTSHPSPLGYFHGFNENNHFKKCNQFFKEYNIKNIDWGGKCFQQEKLHILQH